MPQPKVIRIILIVRAVLADVCGGLSLQSYLIKSTLSTVHNLSESCQCVQLTFSLTRRLTAIQFNNMFRAFSPLERGRMNRVSLGNQKIDVIQLNGVGARMGLAGTLGAFSLYGSSPLSPANYRRKQYLNTPTFRRP